MPLAYRTRRRLSLLVLLVGLPVWILSAVTILGWFERPPFLLELALYLALGILWALPFRAVFRGVAQPDPDNPDGKRAE